MPYKDRDAQRAYQARWVAARREESIRARGSRCQKCGAGGPFEFDHIDPDLKVDHRIWSWSRERLEAELEKCQMLCAECHRLKTRVDLGYGEWQHGTLTGYKKYNCKCGKCREANRDYIRKWRSRARG